ncbi:MAG: hypothetical protein CMJ49_07860 [Planctomycetaceae bacterium]|nr:hypothetical protein [Planctomycetaceae bacterium]
MCRVDGRSYWFGGYFGAFDRRLMIEHAGAARADRFDETLGGRVPLAGARLVSVYDDDRAAAEAFGATFDVPVAATLEEFAEGMDGVIVPFPAGGDARDYRAVAPLVERGIPLFLDRIILEQADVLRGLLAEGQDRGVPLHVTCFMRYLDECLRPADDAGAPVRWVTATASGDPVGYGADLLDLIDALMGCRPVSVINVGDDGGDVLRIGYERGRHAILQLIRDTHVPMVVAAGGADWHRSVELDGSQFHRGAMRQFEAFVRAMDTREPPVAADRILTHANLLRFAESRRIGVVHSLS